MLKTLSISLLTLWAALPLIMWLLRLVVFKRLHGMILFIVTFAIGYVLFVGCAWVADVAIERRMNSFDLDGDGGIGGDKLTPEAQEAIDDWASDTGRALAVFIGFPVSIIWAAIWLIPLFIVEWIVRRLIGKQNPR